MKLKILALLPVIGQPRHAKRIEMLVENGFDVTIYSFEREWPKGRIPSLPYRSLGFIEKKNYFKRIPHLINALRIIYKERNCFDVFFCFSHDLLYITILSTLFKKKHVILEIGDIQDHQMKNNILGYLSRQLDRLFLKKVSLLILISNGFIEFYNKIGYNGKIQIIENKLEPLYRGKSILYRPLGIKNFEMNRRIRIGLFGALNDEWAFDVLTSLVKNYQNKFELFVAGTGACIKRYNINKSNKNKSGIIYYGEYKSPDDLEFLYSNVDIIWACYFPFKKYDINHMSGRPNRFYEACFFKKPIISRCGVSFSNDVEKYSIGICLSTLTVNSSIHILSRITKKEINIWTQNMSNVPEDVYILKNESNMLASNILSLI